ncbi:MAG: FlgD immunoglobulin-like domain containing protein, partial [Candidatus Cloacimonadaceae bacterium]|nr:FlgD immunoglobulin-like domain containing protein [Candidatus Cloacimonadaceae bacterium]
MKKVVILLILTLVSIGLAAQELNDYRSVGNGEWNTMATWEYWNGSAWVTPAVRPTNISNNITIRNGHTVVVTTNVSIDQTIVEVGATLRVNMGTLTAFNGSNVPDVDILGTLMIASTGAVSGATATLWITGTCDYARNGGNLPRATWRPNSTLILSGLTNLLPGNRNQTFCNMTWDCPNQNADLNTLSANFRTFNGLLKVVSTGTGAWVWTNVTNSTKIINSYEQSGGTVIINSGTASIVTYLHSSFVMSGGTLTETGTATGCAFVFQYFGTVFDKSGGTISEQISFTINNSASLDILNDPLTGSGSFTLSFGGTLGIYDPDGITKSSNIGAVRVTGTRTYNSGASYYYTGTLPQVTGDGLPATVYDLTIDNPAGVALTNPLTVTNMLYVLNGCCNGTFSPDGYYSPDVLGLYIEPSGELINNLEVAVSHASLMPYRINRSWNLSGNFIGYKSITFYWNASADNNADWEMNGWAPAAYNGSIEHLGYYDVSSDPRWLTIFVEDTISKGVWTIGRDDDETLPVQMSSFTATLNQQNYVTLRWITQSETNLSGFYVLRGNSGDLNSASTISPLIEAANSSSGYTYLFEDRELEPGMWHYWLQSLELDGSTEFFGPVSQTIHQTGDNSIPEIPIASGIHGVFPNPFNPFTTISYSLDKPAAPRFSIYNTRGQLIRTYETEFRGIGNYSLSWDGKDSAGNTCPTG